MMRQYMDIKAEYKDAILFFRLGDFYEMFFEDAKLVSRLLELTLTGKNCGLEERAPMCGVPFHSADTYIARLVEMGYKVAICEQLEEPSQTKRMVRRGVVKVVTPGTVTSDMILRENENNYLAAVCLAKNGVSLAYADISTGEFSVTEKAADPNVLDDIVNELNRIRAREILISDTAQGRYDIKKIRDAVSAFVRILPESYCPPKTAEEIIRTQMGNVPMTALGLNGRGLSRLAAGTLLVFLHETQMQDLRQMTNITYYEIGSRMSLDKVTIRNLEITETLFEKKVKGSLLGVLDHTGTAMGGRKLRQWLREPLNSAGQINRRLDAVGELAEDLLMLEDLRSAFKKVYDFERLSGRIASGNANGKDMIALKNSIGALPIIHAALKRADCDLLRELDSDLGDHTEIFELISQAIVEDPPLTIKEGGLIKPGYSEELDAIEDSIKDAKIWISGLDVAEKERTGITHLKVGYNKVFGYYIEVSRSNLDLVPDDYIRKQTLVGAERFITPKLKEMESLVLNAETKINRIQYDLFTELREKVGEHIQELQKTSRAIAVLDVLSAFADAGVKYGYVRPAVDNSLKLEIEKGRHPVIEQMTKQGLFVSNDTYMDDTSSSMLIITGPNMSGKSTYMRQTALIVLMAQIGCFVPARRAHIGVVDRIFTRIGASDNLAQGQSTFYVEMSELAYILRNAGERSLVILDEIGRGTSTYDGLSIAWSTVEYLCNENRHIRTLFATHYHELTMMEESIRGVKNLTIDVSEENEEIVFLHKIIPGSASRSYGVHVARLAGVPQVLLDNAEFKLKALESEDSAAAVSDAFRTSSYDIAAKKETEEQLSFFTQAINPAVEKLRNIDLMEVTPSQAIRILEDLKALTERK